MRQQLQDKEQAIEVRTIFYDFLNVFLCKCRVLSFMTGLLQVRENREKLWKIFPAGKNQGIWKFCRNQGIIREFYENGQIISQRYNKWWSPLMNYFYLKDYWWFLVVAHLYEVVTI